MKKEDFLNALTKIGTSEDDVERRTEIAKLTDEVNNLYDTNETLTNENNTYKENNEKLRSANMELFLRVGDKNEPDDNNSNNHPKRKFEDLFNEKGMIK